MIFFPPSSFVTAQLFQDFHSHFSYDIHVSNSFCWLRRLYVSEHRNIKILTDVTEILSNIDEMFEE